MTTDEALNLITLLDEAIQAVYYGQADGGTVADLSEVKRNLEDEFLVGH